VTDKAKVRVAALLGSLLTLRKPLQGDRSRGTVVFVSGRAA
jgi:hypothetical protein